MAQELNRSTAGRIGTWIKWKSLRVVQLLGFLLVALGAYPFLRPFVASVATPPAVVDNFVAAFYPTIIVAGTSLPTVRAFVFIGGGAALTWVATARRFH